MAAELDLFGIGWRDRLAAGIFTHLDEIDVVEIIAENYLDSPARQRRSLRALGCERPLLVHGVGLGAASMDAVDAQRASRLARLIGELQPAAWSEHLGFVRSGGHEIGHMAAPPRTAANIEGTLRNLSMLRRVVGTSPVMENIATLMRPPASKMGEPEWVNTIAAQAEIPLLLDLHNLYANAVNFGEEPHAYLRRFALDRVRIVHISGGVWIPGFRNSDGPRLLDDHLHDVPEPVFSMLEALGAMCPQPFTVILERDGCFPTMGTLLQQLRRARNAVAAGRARRDRRAA